MAIEISASTPLTIHADCSVLCWKILFGIMYIFKKNIEQQQIAFIWKSNWRLRFIWRWRVTYRVELSLSPPVYAVISCSSVCFGRYRHVRQIYPPSRPRAIIASFFICHAGECSPGVYYVYVRNLSACRRRREQRYKYHAAREGRDPRGRGGGRECERIGKCMG